MSKQREAIYEAVASTGGHPTAEWVYLRVRSKMPRLSMGTVYRNLRAMVREGRIIELNTTKGTSRYDANISRHSHFRCMNCEWLQDIELPELEWSSSKLKDFKIIDCRVELIGICPACAEKQGIKS